MTRLIGDFAAGILMRALQADADAADAAFEQLASGVHDVRFAGGVIYADDVALAETRRFKDAVAAPVGR